VKRVFLFDRTIALAALGAAIVVQALLFSAGWLVGAFAGEPARRPPARAAAPPPAPREPEREAVRVPAAEIVELDPTPLRQRPSPPPAPSYEALIREAALRNGLPPQLIRAVTRVESDFDPRDVSNKGARGLMQVMPETGARFGVPADRLFEPAPNIAAGSAYLAWLRDRYHGDLDLVLAAYNAGEGAVDQYRGIPPYRETQTYVKRVRSAMARMQSVDVAERQ